MELSFLCSFLGLAIFINAKIAGLETGITITNHQYDTGLCVYYATYIARSVEIGEPQYP